jgi:hypothetical protein
MPTSNGELHLFLLKADGLVRCRWDGNSERVEILDRALNGETCASLCVIHSDATVFTRRL